MSQNGTAAVAAAGFTENMNTVGLGYGIAIAVGILVLVSTIMLASYVCVRVHGRAGARVRGVTTSMAAGSSRGDEAQRAQEAIPSSYGDGMGMDSALPPRDDNAATVHQQNGEWAIGGLDEATLESYPKFSYGEKKFQLLQQDDGSCSICLADYKDGELLRILPDCRHSFHVPCIDAWLRLHASCPMCRTSPLPTPISTPLSELIPLARHPLQVRYR